MRESEDEQLELAKNRGYRQDAVVDGAYARGELDDEGWHRAMAAVIVPAYLGADNPRAGSGHSGTAADWEYSRGIVAEAIDRSGTFLDVGCANGLLMESIARWAKAAGQAIEPYGLDIAPELAELARKRVPQWAARIAVGNALGYRPARRFEFVRTGLEYVPRPRRRELVAWLLDEVVAPGGRLILGKVNEEVERRELEHDLTHWGFYVAGRAERAHRKEPRLAYRVAWIDVPPASEGALGFRSLRREDLPRLQRWSALPHVARYWRMAFDLPGTERKYIPRITGDEPSHVYIFEQNAGPIGFIQWYRWRDYPEHAAKLGAAASTAGVDLAIGEEALLGRGLGPQAIAGFVRRIVFADPAITACVCDPEVENPRSLRAFEKAGFHVAREIELDGLRRRVMVLER